MVPPHNTYGREIPLAVRADARVILHRLAAVRAPAPDALHRYRDDQEDREQERAHQPEEQERLALALGDRRGDQAEQQRDDHERPEHGLLPWDELAVPSVKW
jgi:hypothetical protein